MSDLGDLDDFLQDHVPNLSWLSVDERALHDLDKLPKQNLDVIPDLVAAWSHRGEAPSSFVPNRGVLPRTMGDMSAEHGLLRADPADIRKMARFAMMQSTDLQRWKHAILQRFDQASVSACRQVLADVLTERGLLGKLYIAASDFPSCASKSQRPSEFVRRYAQDAKYVVAKPQCHGCQHAKAGIAGAPTCAVFHKQIVVDVPMTPELAEQVEQEQSAKGLDVQATRQVEAVPRERIRLAMLAPAVALPQPIQMPKPVESVQRLLREAGAPEAPPVPQNLTWHKAGVQTVIDQALLEGRYTADQAAQALRVLARAASVEDIEQVRMAANGQVAAERPVYEGAGSRAVAPARYVSPDQVSTQLIAAQELTRKRDEQTRMMLAAEKARPVLSHIKRDMLRGRSHAAVVEGMRLAFSADILAQTKPLWEPLLQESGLYGVVYSTQESFDNCREGADFLATHNPTVKAIVKGSKCAGCVYGKVGRCLLYGKPLVASANEVETPVVVGQVLREHHQAGRIAPWDTQWLQMNPREALQQMHHAVSPLTTMGIAPTRTHIETAFLGHGSTPHVTRQATVDAIVKKAQQYLNEGLYGQSVVDMLRSEFEERDLRASAAALRKATTEQGLQGIYYVDPTLYNDYGKGCEQASRLFRAKQVPYAVRGDKCASCVFQSQPGVCSKLNKSLVANASTIPYPTDKRALQREVLASGSPLEIRPENLVNNGADMLREFQIQQSHVAAYDIELLPEAKSEPMTISFGGQGVKL